MCSYHKISSSFIINRAWLNSSPCLNPSTPENLYKLSRLVLRLLFISLNFLLSYTTFLQMLSNAFSESKNAKQISFSLAIFLILYLIVNVWHCMLRLLLNPPYTSCNCDSICSLNLTSISIAYTFAATLNSLILTLLHLLFYELVRLSSFPIIPYSSFIPSQIKCFYYDFPPGTIFFNISGTTILTYKNVF